MCRQHLFSTTPEPVFLLPQPDTYIQSLTPFLSAQAARHVVDRVAKRRAEGTPPFHWFRNILKTPTWYVKTHEAIQQLNPKIELLDAPTFFELYRIYLENQNDR